MPRVSPIFQAGAVLGRHQIRGNINGPTKQNAMTIKDVRKYHGNFSPASRGCFAGSKNSPQCLHFIAASWISSAQKGHFFIILSLGRRQSAKGDDIHPNFFNPLDIGQEVVDLIGKLLLQRQGGLNVYKNNAVFAINFGGGDLAV